jgi:hypothetical protein
MTADELDVLLDEQQVYYRARDLGFAVALHPGDWRVQHATATRAAP